MNSSEAERFCGRTMELANDICDAYTIKIAEYATIGASAWKKNDKSSLAVFASIIGVGLIGGTMIAAVREKAGDEAANVARDVLLAAMEHAAKP